MRWSSASVCRKYSAHGTKASTLMASIIVGLPESEVPGCYRLSRPGEILRCPWHGWEFDLRTGKSHCDPQGLFTRQYKTSVERETSSPETCGDGGLTAETFPVIVEEAVVFVEV